MAWSPYYWVQKKNSIFLVSRFYFLVFLLEVTPPCRGKKAYRAFRALDQEGYFLDFLQGEDRATREFTSDERERQEPSERRQRSEQKLCFGEKDEQKTRFRKKDEQKVHFKTPKYM